MDRAQALEILHEYLKSEHLIRHSFAVEAVMKALAERLAPDKVEEWSIAGLLHDIDADITDYKTNPELHGKKAVEILKERNFGTEEMHHAILAHNSATGTEIETQMDQALYAADPITGFITAIALVYPDKKLSSVKVKSITKRMKEPRFAAGADRDAMRSIEKLGIPFAEFAELSLKAMTEIADTLGL